MHEAVHFHLFFHFHVSPIFKRPAAAAHIYSSLSGLKFNQVSRDGHLALAACKTPKMDSRTGGISGARKKWLMNVASATIFVKSIKETRARMALAAASIVICNFGWWPNERARATNQRMIMTIIRTESKHVCHKMALMAFAYH